MKYLINMSSVLLTIFCFASFTNSQTTLSESTNEITPGLRNPMAHRKLLDEPATAPSSRQTEFGPNKPLIGGVDPSFLAGITEGNPYVYSLATQPDGKFLAGGTFSSINGVARGSLERFNVDGTRDLSFNPGGTGANGAVYVIIVLPDGKFMISGGFSTYNGSAALRIARLNADGTLDAAFTPQGTSVNGSPQDMIIQPDGKILISGSFTSFNGTVRNNVARLNADGTLDTAFNPNVNGFTEELVLQPDGKIVIGGVFSTVGGVGRNSIARLNADGTLDETFNVGNGVFFESGLGSIYAASRQADGKILIGGSFTSYDFTPRQNIARLNIDGSLDTSFNPGTAGTGAEFFAIQPDGKIVVVGAFSSFNIGITRLNSDGSFDSSFIGGQVDDSGYVVALQADGKILFGGLFNQYGGVERNAIVRINADGTPDTFAAVPAADPNVRTVLQQPDGKILVGGQFRRANGILRRNLARFNLDGTLDISFDPGNNCGGFNRPSVWSIGLQLDGKVIVGGNFSIFYGNPNNYVARLNANGSLDNSFFYPDALTVVRDIDVRPDSKIVLAGLFQNDGLQIFSGIVRLNSNGSYDQTVLGTGANNVVIEIEPLPDGKALIGGSFTNYNGTSRNRIARINSDGTLDSTFDPGTGANSTVYDFVPLANGQTYVSGFFTNFNGIAGTNDVVRLNANGSVDTTFNTGLSGFNGGVYTLSLEPDGKLLAGGNFNAYNGTNVNRLVLLSTTGTLDTSFVSPLDNNAFNFVYKLYRQADGRVLVGGGFTNPRIGLFRLNATPTMQAPFDFDGDGKTDVGIFRAAGGEWWWKKSSDSVVAALQFGVSTDVIAPGDFTGDGKLDHVVWRPSDGFWHVLRSEDFAYYGGPFGVAGDVPVTGDYDGDGKADAAVFRPSSSTWFINRSSDGGTTITGFGAAGDVPVTADYDGDGRDDIGIYRPSLGQWWINRSTAGILAMQFGAATDRTVPGDYTGDGKADIAFWRPATGEWYIVRSEDSNFYAFPFGAAGDIPVPGDYDGDGKIDAAVFRNGTWFINGSTTGTQTIAFGTTGDRPIPNSFVR